MSRYFFRCRACGLPHEVGTSVCPLTQQPIPPASPSVAPPPPGPPASTAPKPRTTPRPPAQAPPRPPSGTHAAPPAGLPASTDLLKGSTIGGRYKIERVLAQGAMGVVYEAVHTGLGRHVAVKVLAELLTSDRAANTRFRREARVTGTLGHPNIVEVFDTGDLPDGTPYLVMELLEGETLRARLLREKSIHPGDALRMTQQILSALSATHKRAVVHRDLKPENIFLVYKDGLAPIVKVLDFGLSKRTVQRSDDDTQATLTQMGFVMGTPEYMAPEQAGGDRNFDGRVDLFATGIMAYEMLVGERPFKSRQLLDLLLEMRDKVPASPRALGIDVPEYFDRAVLKLIARDPEDRYQSADEALAALSHG